MHYAPPETSPRRGFTLIELLVALAIVAVILAILIPSLRSFREQANSVRCLKNMSEVGRILLAYSAESGGIVIAPVVLQPPNYTSGKTWNVQLDELGLLRKESYNDLKQGVMSCPSRQSAGSYVYNKMHYGVNRNPGFDSIGFAGRASIKVLRIQNPARTMLLGEVKKDYMIQTTSDSLMENIVYPHNMRANVFFYDGHAENIAGPWARPTAAASYPFY